MEGEVEIRIDQIRVQDAEYTLSDRDKLDAEPCRGWAGIAGVSRLGPALIAIWRAWTLIGPHEGAKDGKTWVEPGSTNATDLEADCGWISLFGDGTDFGVGINGAMLSPGQRCCGNRSNERATLTCDAWKTAKVIKWQRWLWYRNATAAKVQEDPKKIEVKATATRTGRQSAW